MNPSVNLVISFEISGYLTHNKVFRSIFAVFNFCNNLVSSSQIFGYALFLRARLSMSTLSTESPSQTKANPTHRAAGMAS